MQAREKKSRYLFVLKSNCSEIESAVKKGKTEAWVREETVISSIVRGSLSFVGPKEKTTNESIEACQTLEDNWSCGAYLRCGSKVCWYREQEMCIFINCFPAQVLQRLLMILYSKNVLYL